MAGEPTIDHLQGGGVPAADHFERLRFVATRQPGTLHIHLAPALREVRVHPREDQEKKRLLHFIERPEDLLDVARAIRLRAAVGEIERIHDFFVIARRDPRLPKERHHARQALDVLLHHDRRHGDARIFGELVLAAERLGELRVVRLGPDGEEILRERDARGGAALSDLHDPICRLLEIRSGQDCVGKAHVHAVPSSGRKRRSPFPSGRGRQ